MIDLDHLSYSSINLYSMCARAWRFRYLDKVQTPKSPALVFGSAFHNAIETAIANKDVSAPAEGYWDAAWNDATADGEIDWQKDKPETFYNLGVKMLKSKETLELLSEIKPFDAESIEKKIELQVPGVPIPIIGYIDIIERDGVPADFKTSSRSWNPGKALEELQPCFYLAAMNQAGWQNNPDFKFRHYVFVKTKTPKAQVFESNRLPGELFWMFGLIQEVWRGIEARVFPPTGTGSWKCSPKWCEYWALCKG